MTNRWTWDVTVANNHDALHNGRFETQRVTTFGPDETDASLSALQLVACFGDYVAGISLVDWTDEYTGG